MNNFSLIMYRLLSNKTVFQFSSQSTEILLQKLCSFVFFLLNGMSNESSMNKIMVDCDKLMKSYWRIQALIQEFQSINLVQNFNEFHRMPKVVVFLCKQIVSETVNCSSFIGRYIWKIHDKVSKSINEFKIL